MSSNHGYDLRNMSIDDVRKLGRIKGESGLHKISANGSTRLSEAAAVAIESARVFIPEPASCNLCEKGFPLRGENHIPIQSLGMISITRCKGLPPAGVAKPKRKAKLLSIAIFLPIRLVSEMNTSEHWAKYQARNKAQQEELKIEWYRLTRNAKIELPALVRFTRIGQKRLDPGNLEASFKHVQDAICSCLGVDDGSDLIKFEYAQEATGKREYGVRVEVVSL